ncbi:hypothetical protein NM208_g15464 [Fusarium decemcellulare]|uniref:Uncharacterized protein n=1 Tax=Fusarium decemcellulare TaxID=57161 RepID=A0ACC1REF8_9HYPO|nr:hypothetical protein NM208_g15464 [Fusarium decemcellulare]
MPKPLTKIPELHTPAPEIPRVPRLSLAPTPKGIPGRRAGTPCFSSWRQWPIFQKLLSPTTANTRTAANHLAPRDSEVSQPLGVNVSFYSSSSLGSTLCVRRASLSFRKSSNVSVTKGSPRVTADKGMQRGTCFRELQYERLKRPVHSRYGVFATVQSSAEEQAPPRYSVRSKGEVGKAKLERKGMVSLLTAADFWRTKAIPEKGIPAIKTTDGPNGARGGIFVGGTKAALFPCGISLAATWNKDLLYQVGQHLALEAKARSAEMLLAPTVCMHRHPLGGRNFESFSEDPLLTGKLAAQYIKGLQDRGVAATIKHSLVTERPLREIYLRPFEIAIREANPWAVMSSYNLINGVHADLNKHTLKDILRGEWNYDGTVVSDWGGINSSVESVQAGCDIEFPYSSKWRLDKLVTAANEGRIQMEDIDQAAENVLTLVERLKGSDIWP